MYSTYKATYNVIRFNNLVSSISDIRVQGQIISPLLVEVDKLAGSDITISRLSFSSLSEPVILNGNVSSQDAAISFKNRIIGQSKFSNVDLPLSGLFDDGSVVSFTITFEVESLDFSE